MPWLSGAVPVQAESREAVTKLLEAQRLEKLPQVPVINPAPLLSSSLPLPTPRVAEEVPTAFTLRDFISVFAGPRLTRSVNGQQQGT